MTADQVVSNESYHAWLSRLTELLEFHDGESNVEWKCGSEGDQYFYARQAASELRLDYNAVVKRARVTGSHACCDCEFLFNCDDREVEDDWGDESWLE